MIVLTVLLFSELLQPNSQITRL